jgi:hypothetical protein
MLKYLLRRLGLRLLRTAEASPCSLLAATLDALPIPQLPGALFDLRGGNSPIPPPSSDTALARAVAMIKGGGGGDIIFFGGDAYYCYD